MHLFFSFRNNLVGYGYQVSCTIVLLLMIGSVCVSCAVCVHVRNANDALTRRCTQAGNFAAAGRGRAPHHGHNLGDGQRHYRGGKVGAAIHVNVDARQLHRVLACSGDVEVAQLPWSISWRREV
jgi:hypothetical protein